MGEEVKMGAEHNNNTQLVGKGGRVSQRRSLKLMTQLCVPMKLRMREGDGRSRSGTDSRHNMVTFGLDKQARQSLIIQ